MADGYLEQKGAITDIILESWLYQHSTVEWTTETKK